MTATPNQTATPTPTDLAMMRRALTIARSAGDAGEVPVGAVVYRGDTVLGEGANQRESLNDPTAHAEMLGLRQAAQRTGSWRLSGCSIAVTLEPCPMCAGAIINARVSRVIYGAQDPKMGCVDTLYQLCDDDRFNHRPDSIGGVLADQSAELLRSFFQARRGAKSGIVRS